MTRAEERAWDVCKHGADVVLLAHAQVGHQRREGVVRDLGARRADRGQQRALARVRHAHDAHVCVRRRRGRSQDMCERPCTGAAAAWSGMGSCAAGLCACSPQPEELGEGSLGDVSIARWGACCSVHSPACRARHAPATSFSSRLSQDSSPASPCSASWGALHARARAQPGLLRLLLAALVLCTSRLGRTLSGRAQAGPATFARKDTCSARRLRQAFPRNRQASGPRPGVPARPGGPASAFTFAQMHGTF